MTHFVTTDQFDKFFNENTENKAAKENEDPLTDIKTVNPGNIGWIQGKINDEWMKYLWECIEQSKKDDKSWKDRLIGHVETSLSLNDKDNLFFKQCLLPLVYTFEKLYSDGISSDLRSGTTLFTKNSKYTFVLREWWVNFQKAGDFQPLHNHGGIFSFVIWMKIPFDYEEQNKNPIAATANIIQPTGLVALKAIMATLAATRAFFKPAKAALNLATITAFPNVKFKAIIVTLTCKATNPKAAKAAANPLIGVGNLDATVNKLFNP